MNQGGLKEILFKTSKITKFASRIGSVDMNNHMILKAELAQEHCGCIQNSQNK